MTSGTDQPRSEFARGLEDWFVEELRQPITLEGSVHGLPGHPTPLPVGEPPQSRGGRGRWFFTAVGVGAAAIVVVVALAVQPSTRSTETAVPVESLSDRSRAICEGYALDARSLPLGADRDEVAAVVEELTIRLEVVRDELEALRSEFDVEISAQVRLVDELSVTVDRLSRVAEGERSEIDQAVMNYDLLLLAWGDRMNDLSGSGCDQVPTLREQP